MKPTDRNIIEVKSPEGRILARVAPTKDCRRKFMLMSEDSITLKFSLRDAVDFPIGSSAGDFVVTRKQTGVWNANTGVWDYTLQLNARYMAWANRLMFYHTKGTSGAKETSFSLTGSIHLHANLIKNVLDALGMEHEGSPYRVDFAGKEFGEEAKLVSYNNLSILGAIQAIAEAWECEWWATGNVVCFGKCLNEDTGEVFEAGVNVSSISFQNGRTEAPNRIYVFGSDRNLPPNYRHTDSDDTVGGVVNRRLMLPEGTPYLQIRENIPDAELVESVVTIGDVYPRTDLTIPTDPETYTAPGKDEEGNATTETFYRIRYNSDFLFSRDYVLEGEDSELHVIFQSGVLCGMDFGVKFNPKGLNERNSDGSWNPEAQMFEIVANEDYGRKLPDLVLKPSKGDKFILYGWDATKMENLGLIAKAEKELLEKGREELEEYTKDISNCTCPMAWDYMKRLFSEGTLLMPGDVVSVIDTAHFGEGAGRKSRIIGFEYALDIPYAEFTYTCGENISSSRISSLEAAVESLKKDGQSVKISNSADFLSKRYSDRTPYALNVGGKLTGESGVQFGRTFLPGIAGGIGGFVDGEGNGELESLVLRRFLEVPELRYNRTEVTVGNQWNAPGGGIIERVEPSEDGTGGTAWLKLEEGEIGTVSVGDIAMGIFHFQEGNSTETSDNGKGEFRFAGFTTVYFTITKVEDDEGVNNKFTYILRKGWPQHPQPSMTFVCYGNTDKNKPERQRSKYSTRSYTRYLDKVDQYEFAPVNVMAQFGDLTNLSLDGYDMEGYGAYINNLYFSGTLQKINNFPLEVELTGNNPIISQTLPAKVKVRFRHAFNVIDSGSYGDLVGENKPYKEAYFTVNNEEKKYTPEDTFDVNASMINTGETGSFGIKGVLVDRDNNRYSDSALYTPMRDDELAFIKSTTLYYVEESSTPKNPATDIAWGNAGRWDQIESQLKPGSWLYSRLMQEYGVDGVTKMRIPSYSVSRIGADGESGKGIHIAYAEDITLDAAGKATACKGFKTVFFTEAAWMGVYTAKEDSETPDSDKFKDYNWSRIKGEDGSSYTSNLVPETAWLTEKSTWWIEEANRSAKSWVANQFQERGAVRLNITDKAKEWLGCKKNAYVNNSEGDKFTFSIWCKVNSSLSHTKGAGIAVRYGYVENNKEVLYDPNNAKHETFYYGQADGNKKQIPARGEWFQMFVHAQVPENTGGKTIQFLELYFFVSNTGDVQFSSPKLERGWNDHPEWSPHPDDLKGADGKAGEPGAQGYGVVAFVSREGWPDSDWDKYAAKTAPENYMNTASIRNGCRIGDFFEVSGTSQEGKIHTLLYQSDTNEGDLHGVSIRHTVIPKGEAGPEGAVMRVRPWATDLGKLYNGTYVSASDPVRWLDIVEVTDSNGRNQQYFQYIGKPGLEAKNITAPVHNSTATTQYWKPMSDVGAIYASSLFAPNARINFLNGQEIVLIDSYNKVVGRLGQPKGKDDSAPTIWMGAETPDSSSFNLRKNGQMILGSVNGQRLDFNPSTKLLNVYNSANKLVAQYGSVALQTIDSKGRYRGNVSRLTFNKNVVPEVVEAGKNQLNFFSSYQYPGVSKTATIKVNIPSVAITLPRGTNPSGSGEAKAAKCEIKAELWIASNGSYSNIRNTTVFESTALQTSSTTYYTMPCELIGTINPGQGFQVRWYIRQITIPVSGDTATIEEISCQVAVTEDLYQARYGENGFAVSQNNLNYVQSKISNGVLDFHAVSGGYEVYPRLLFKATVPSGGAIKDIITPSGLMPDISGRTIDFTPMKSLFPGGEVDTSRLIVNVLPSGTANAYGSFSGNKLTITNPAYLTVMLI